MTKRSSDITAFVTGVALLTDDLTQFLDWIGSLDELLIHPAASNGGATGSRQAAARLFRAESS
jgi:hypothetical protein